MKIKISSCFPRSLLNSDRILRVYGHHDLPLAELDVWGHTPDGAMEVRVPGHVAAKVFGSAFNISDVTEVGYPCSCCCPSLSLLALNSGSCLPPGAFPRRPLSSVSIVRRGMFIWTLVQILNDAFFRNARARTPSMTPINAKLPSMPVSSSSLCNTLS